MSVPQTSGKAGPPFNQQLRRSGREQPMYQPQSQGVWRAIREAHKRIDDMGEKLGDMKEDIATIKASMLTEEKLLRLLDRDRREEATYRELNADRYQQLRNIPVEQREQRNSHYAAEQAHLSQNQFWLAVVTLFLSPLLSVLAVHLFR